MTIYSAHDTTVFALLAALGVTDKAPIPHFTANVVIELWQRPPYEESGAAVPANESASKDTAGGEAWRSKRFHLRVRYNGAPLEGVVGCDGASGEGCELAAFADATKGRRMKARDCKAAGSARDRLGADDTSCCDDGDGGAAT